MWPSAGRGARYSSGAIMTCTMLRCRLLRATLPRISRPQSAPLRARERLRPRNRPTTQAYAAYQRDRLLVDAAHADLAQAQPGVFPSGRRTGPAYAEPWAGKADAYITSGFRVRVADAARSRAGSRKKRCSRTRIDPNLVEVHTSLASPPFSGLGLEGAETRSGRPSR